MKHSTIINAAPWFAALGIILLLIAIFTKSPLDKPLTMLSLVILSSVLGALTTHFPNSHD